MRPLPTGGIVYSPLEMLLRAATAAFYAELARLLREAKR